MNTIRFKLFAILSLTAVLCWASPPSALAGNIWDGGAGTGDWGNPTNWDDDSLPTFDCTNSLSVIANKSYGAGTTNMLLGADRCIGRITMGAINGTRVSLSGYTLRLTSTTTTNTNDGALWNASTIDGLFTNIVVNSAILLSAGTSGVYTGHFREVINSNGGTWFNGPVRQAEGESWTLRFSRAYPSGRGLFVFTNPTNSISAIRNDGADIYFEAPGALGGAALTLASGWTGVRNGDFYNTPITNSITMTGAALWDSKSQTRFTGTFAQGNNALTFGVETFPSSRTLTRLEFSSRSGNGATTIAGGTVAVGDMSQLSTNVLNLGTGSYGQGVLVLSGTSGFGVPTWAEFTANRTNNPAGGFNTWRINAPVAMAANVFRAGGFAARGADLVIPASGGGLNSNTFACNFFLGSPATLDGVRYANNAVKIQTDIAYGNFPTRLVTNVVGGVTNVYEASTNVFFGAAWNEGTMITGTAPAEVMLTLAGPIHELAGQITGSNVTLYPVGSQDLPQTRLWGQFGIIRISNPANNLTGESRWIIGGARTWLITAGGRFIPSPMNMGDQSTIALIFTSDGAFGDAAEVQVGAFQSDVSRTVGILLLEDANPVGPTVFGRPIAIKQSSAYLYEGDWSAPGKPPVFGSYVGDVIYTGQLTFATLPTELTHHWLVHAEAGSTLSFDNGATFSNTSTYASPIGIAKTGAGTVYVNDFTNTGNAANHNWRVRQGYLGGRGTITGDVVVEAGAGLRPGAPIGTLTINGSLSLDAESEMYFDLGTNSDKIVVGNALTLDGTARISNAGGLATGDYVLMTCGGDLTDNGLEVEMPVGFEGTVEVDTGSSPKRVLLHVTATGVSDPYEQWQYAYFGGPGNPAAAGNADPDGDGMINTNEFLAGFCPTNSAAYLHIISITRSGNNLTITYLAANGDTSYSSGPQSCTNVLEYTTGSANGSYSNNFFSTGQTNIFSGGTGLGTVASFIETNAATYTPSRYYRVRVLTP